MKLTYSPQVFDVLNLESARGIILTQEGAASTDERWVTETPYLTDLIENSLSITSETVLIDYGCGVGRLSKELIARNGCRIIGVDISANMRAMAIDYVRSDRFFSCAPEMLDTLIQRGFVADAAFSVWVLQHCFAPSDDIARIHRSLAPGGSLFVVNNKHRAVPTNEGWADDGVDIKSLLGKCFSLTSEGVPLDEKIAPKLRGLVFWASFRKTA
jgi:SAM-dependent methyltransferase